MDKIWQKISSMFLALAMTVTMTHKARAAEGGEAAPPDPAPQSVTEPEPDGEETVSAPQEEEDPSGEDGAAGEAGDPAGEADPSEEEDDPAEEEDDPAGEDAPAGDGDDISEEEDASGDGEGPSEDEGVPAGDEGGTSGEEDASAGEEADPAGKQDGSDGDEEDIPEEDDPSENEDDPVNEDDPSGDGDDPAAEGEDPAEEEDAPGEDTDATTGEEDVPAGDGGAEPEEEGGAPAADRTVFVVRSARFGGMLRAPGGGEDPGEEAPGEGGEEAPESDPEEPAATEVVLVGDIGAQNVNSENDIIIKTAGLQHITSLTSDGDVYIVGTGILLVDSVDLLYGRNVYLQSLEELYGENGGTVGLFLFTGEKDGVRSYELINSGYEDSEGEHVIAAILDEEYVLPAGINLVVPDGGSVLMQCVNTIVETVTGEGGETETGVYRSLTGDPVVPDHTGVDPENIIREFIESAPTLTVSAGSSLSVRAGASFLLTHINFIGKFQFHNTAKIIVDGMIDLEGDITNGCIDIGATGDVTGPGKFVDTRELTVQARSTPLTTLNAENANLYFPDGTDISSLNVSGSTEVLSYESWTVDSLTVNDGTLEVYNYGLDEADDITVTGTISGNGTIDLLGARILLAGGSDACSAVINTETRLSYAHSAEEGTLRYNTETGSLEQAPLIPLVGEASVADGQAAIPVASATIVEHHFAASHGTMNYYKNLETAVDDESNPVIFTCGAGAALSYHDLDSVLDDGAGNKGYFVETCTGGVYGYQMLYADSTETVTASSVVQIVCGELLKTTAPDGSGTLTSTDTTYTGSGILGSNAGSASGGAKRLALTGTRGGEDPDPDGPDDPDPKTPEKSAEIRVWTEEAPDGCFDLQIEIKGKAVSRLDAPVKVSMTYDAGKETRPLYAVFLDGQGNLTAFAAEYDAEASTLSFRSDMAGKFVIVAFEFDGEPFTEAFYKALAGLDAVRALFA